MATTKNIKNYKELRTPIIKEPVNCIICGSQYGTFIRTNKGRKPQEYAHKSCLSKAVNS